MKLAIRIHMHLQKSFEQKFYIPKKPSEAVEKEKEFSHFVYRTGIYKDSVGASMGYPDYQLRPNFTIAMTVVSC